MFYTCQICGLQFEQQRSCIEHETDCFKKHRTAAQMTNELNALISLAESKKIKFGVNIVRDGKAVFCLYDKAVFDVKNNVITLNYILNETQTDTKKPKKS